MALYSWGTRAHMSLYGWDTQLRARLPPAVPAIGGRVVYEPIMEVFGP